ncbi:hypothetical protein ACLVWU_14610 [Bdellovibrio sp. HCB290]|uniref:hypothetical protein n=1 Tax=Bdellovibrio sp. HCB290 TaxID=3394356 RepID=UPI0039B3EA53
MKSLAALGFLSLLSLQSLAVTTPCGGQHLPSDRSRMATDIQLVCGGGASNFVRRSIKMEPAQFKEWTKQEKLGNRERMQEIRLAEPEIAWKGAIDYSTYVTWTWFSEEYGQNAARCGTHDEPYTCYEDITETVCTKDESSGGGGSGGGGGGSRDYSTGGTGVEGEGGDDMPSARRRNPNGCTTRVVGQRKMTCHKEVANFCRWNEPHNEISKCSDERMTYEAKFNKPAPAQWGPGRSDHYMDILPNKYDLLPGEWENISVVSNFGRSATIRPQLIVDNAWNAYAENKSFQETACRMNNPIHLKVEIDTVNRIKRKTPNTFVTPVDAYGKPMKVLYRNSVGVKDGEAEGEPYEVKLADSGNELVTIAARQSRNLSKLDSGAKVSTVKQNRGNGVLAMPESFWKDTQFRLRLTQKLSLSRDVSIAQNVYTNGGMVMSSDDNVIIPLDGRGGVDSLFRATGPFNFALKNFWEKTRIHLTPGARYELGISMYQRGLPFYESGCAEGQSCEGEKSNDKAFSDEMLIAFTADKRVDERSFFQKFLDWQAGR